LCIERKIAGNIKVRGSGEGTGKSVERSEEMSYGGGGEGGEGEGEGGGGESFILAASGQTLFTTSSFLHLQSKIFLFFYYVF
jgi:hypothetical protein